MIVRKVNYLMSKKGKDFEAEEMTVTIDLEDGSSVECAVITILTVQEKDYIILLPLDENGDNQDGEVWIYGYSENMNDSNEEPVLSYIDNDEEYEMVADAFDEYLDGVEFDELVELNEDEMDEEDED